MCAYYVDEIDGSQGLGGLRWHIPPVALPCGRLWPRQLGCEFCINTKKLTFAKYKIYYFYIVEFNLFLITLNDNWKQIGKFYLRFIYFKNRLLVKVELLERRKYVIRKKSGQLITLILKREKIHLRRNI